MLCIPRRLSKRLRRRRWAKSRRLRQGRRSKRACTSTRIRRRIRSKRVGGMQQYEQSLNLQELFQTLQERQMSTIFNPNEHTLLYTDVRAPDTPVYRQLTLRLPDF